MVESYFIILPYVQVMRRVLTNGRVVYHLSDLSFATCCHPLQRLSAPRASKWGRNAADWESESRGILLCKTKNSKICIFPVIWHFLKFILLKLTKKIYSHHCHILQIMVFSDVYFEIWISRQILKVNTPRGFRDLANYRQCLCSSSTHDPKNRTTVISATTGQPAFLPFWDF